MCVWGGGALMHASMPRHSLLSSCMHAHLPLRPAPFLLRLPLPLLLPCPAAGQKGELHGELVAGMGEALVGNYPGRALSFAASLAPPGEPRLLSLPGKREGLFAGAAGAHLIARSDSNGGWPWCLGRVVGDCSCAGLDRSRVGSSVPFYAGGQSAQRRPNQGGLVSV